MSVWERRPRRDSPAAYPDPTTAPRSRRPPYRGGADASQKPIDEEGGLDLDQTMANIEVGYLKKALVMTEGNYTKAAQILKMSLRSFRYKIQKHGIEKD